MKEYLIVSFAFITTLFPDFNLISQDQKRLSTNLEVLEDFLGKGRRVITNNEEILADADLYDVDEDYIAYEATNIAVDKLDSAVTVDDQISIVDNPQLTGIQNCLL